MARVLLIDLSNNNGGHLDFEAMRRHGVYGLWHKVSESTTFADGLFEARAAAARKAGLRVGGYHFARPERGSALPEADYFVRHLGKVQRRDLRPVLDLEANDHHLSPAAMHEWAATFERRVRQRTGVRPLLYSYSAFITGQRWSRTLGTGAGLWLADYGPNDGHDHGAKPPHPWRSLAAHQFTSVGAVPGVEGHVDLTHAASARKVLAHPVTGR